MQTVLKKIASGLITHQKFPLEELHSPFFSQSNHHYDEGLVLTYGMIYFFLEELDKCVFEVHSKYVPQLFSDLGGISIGKGDYFNNLYEYVSSSEQKDYNYVRVYKEGYSYNGEGSEDGKIWVKKGEVVIPKADVCGVTVQGETPYLIEELKIYKDPCFLLFNLMTNDVVKVFDTTGVLLKAIIVGDTSIVKVELPLYPFSGKIDLYTSEGELKASSDLTDVYGGDEYSNEIDIDLFNEAGENLLLEEAKHFGYVKRGDAKFEEITVKSNMNLPASGLVVAVLPESPAYTWVYISDTLDGTGTFVKEITFSIPPEGEYKFLLRLQQPIDIEDAIPYNPKMDDIFYLEVR